MSNQKIDPLCVGIRFEIRKGAKRSLASPS